MDRALREAEVLRRIRAIFDANTDDSGIIVGNGDDGAVLSLKDQAVIATDMAVEGIHFRLEWSSPEELGRKITAANLADVCAMGGWPTFLVVSVAFPTSFLHSLENLAAGISHEASKVGARIVGGDLSQGNQLVISITALGSADRPIRRADAVVGDAVVVSHLPGLSAAGLALLSSQKNLETDGARTAIAQHCAPSIDYVRYRSAFPFLNSATDISDGLVVDASHIADASSVAIEIDTKKITAHPDFEVISSIATNQEQALDFVLSGGEDHVLLGTTTNPEKCAGFTEIGRVVSGHGVFVDGKRRDGEAGYQHSW